MSKPNLAISKRIRSNGTLVIANLYNDGTTRVFLSGDYVEGTHRMEPSRLAGITGKLKAFYHKTHGAPFKPTAA